VWGFTQTPFPATVYSDTLGVDPLAVLDDLRDNINAVDVRIKVLCFRILLRSRKMVGIYSKQKKFSLVNMDGLTSAAFLFLFQ
jgi:hypothetical protein